MKPQHATDREQQYKLSKEQQEPSILAWWGSVVMFCNEEGNVPLSGLHPEKDGQFHSWRVDVFDGFFFPNKHN
uniref:Uncharacterized protein n=1 Tax=Anguilla anguilla TaxID=7936 RepID=A0A0E9XZ72_ANGAN